MVLNMTPWICGCTHAQDLTGTTTVTVFKLEPNVMNTMWLSQTLLVGLMWLNIHSTLLFQIWLPAMCWIKTLITLQIGLIKPLPYWPMSATETPSILMCMKLVAVVNCTEWIMLDQKLLNPQWLFQWIMRNWLMWMCLSMAIWPATQLT